jgi:hypothetical protein
MGKPGSDDAAAVGALPARPHLGRSAELKDHSAGAFHQRVVEGDFPGIRHQLVASFVSSSDGVAARMFVPSISFSLAAL